MDISASLDRINQAIRQRDLPRALALADNFNRTEPDNRDAWILRARIAQMMGDYESLHRVALKVLHLSPGHHVASLMAAESLVHMGEIQKALQYLHSLEEGLQDDAGALARISEAYIQCGAFQEAETCLQKAVSLAPDNTDIRYHYASSLIATGKLKEAEAQFDRVIALNPHDYDAYYNRANLRRQIGDDNHVEEIQHLLARPLQNPMGRVQLNYALAKELEDLGAYEQSFTALKAGADQRRKMLAYKVSSDIDAMQKIADTFDTNYFKQEHTSCPSVQPIFIVGFPRSGTTLVDRILSAHPEVESLGELTDFALTLTTLCKADGGKAGLIGAASSLDMQTLGKTYVHRALQRANGAAYFIDKTPANFLYIGLIAKALPYAKIIHLNRHPLDVGFGMYKTLFRMGYPFSYNLDDLAHYMKAKDRLMTHWRKMLPGRIIEINYEDIVADQEGQTRKLLTALGLNWDAACLDFYNNKSPSATASAAQVRQPIYKNAVGRWKYYRTGLAPLIKALEISE